MDINPILHFLSELKANNNREWFTENKKKYELVKTQFEALISELIFEFKQQDETLKGLQAKDCIFRIYKDVRFSKDKLPYKTNFGAVIGSAGRKSKNCSLYLQLEPNNSFIACGVYQPEGSDLKKIRQFIYEEFEEFNEIMNAPDFKQIYGQLSQEGDELKRVPQGFPKDWEHAHLLKYKHYICVHTLSNETLEKKELIKHLSKAYKAGQPFNYFLQNAINSDET